MLFRPALLRSSPPAARTLSVLALLSLVACPLLTACAQSQVAESDAEVDDNESDGRRDTGNNDNDDDVSDPGDATTPSDARADDADTGGGDDALADTSVETDADIDASIPDAASDVAADTATDAPTDTLLPDSGDTTDAGISTPDATTDASTDTATDTVSAENCSNGVDDDADTATDCDDLDCLLAPACEIDPPVAAGTCADPVIAVSGTQRAVPAVDQQEASCLSITQNEVVFAFTPPTTGSWCLSTRGGASTDTILSVRTSCGNQSTELFCNDEAVLENDTRFEQRTVPLTAGTRVFVIVDTYASAPPSGPTPEVQLQITPGACGGSGGLVEDLGIIDCTDSLNDIAPADLVGTTLRATCPNDCFPEIYFVIGSDPYRDSSWVCPAARHAGATTLAGGPVLITIVDPLASYAGSTRNGVSTDGSPIAGERAFTVESAP
ncbi:MAG: hypothetical protein KGO50_11450 [Myxococcales bacterium]|nr:hypothetical protein [Myxococcales bacterium]